MFDYSVGLLGSLELSPAKQRMNNLLRLGLLPMSIILPLCIVLGYAFLLLQSCDRSGTGCSSRLPHVSFPRGCSATGL